MPTHDGLRYAIGRGEIGLDVEERRAIQAIETDHRQPVAINAQKLDDAHGDGVGPGRGAQREGPASNAAMSRNLEHKRARRPVHPIEKDDMGAGFDVLESLAPAGVDLDNANRLGFARVLRAVLALFPGCADAADEIDAGIMLAREIDGLLALPDAEVLVGHGSTGSFRSFGARADGSLATRGQTIKIRERTR